MKDIGTKKEPASPSAQRGKPYLSVIIPAYNEEEVINKTKEAFEKGKKRNLKGAIVSLIELNGIGIPIASAILAMRFPHLFAVIDKNVIKALNKRGYINDKYSFWKKKYIKDINIYEKYLSILHDFMEKENLNSLREAERKLFLEGKEKD